MASTTVRIACGADERFALPMAVTLSSALRSLATDRPVAVHVFDGGVRPDSRRRIERVVRRARADALFQWTIPDMGALSGVRTTDAINATAYLRLLLPALLPDEADRVIYLDSDTVVRRDLGGLADTPFNDRPALGVRDYWTPTVTSPGGLDDRANALGISPEAPYCNSGVVVLNLPVWRGEGLARRAFDYTRQYRDVMNRNDQEAINAVVAGRWGLLDPRWNVSLSSVQAKIERDSGRDDTLARCLRDDPWIVHYTSSAKPWHYGDTVQARRVLYYQQTERAVFLEALQSSGWFPTRAAFRRWALPRQAWLGLTHKLPRRLALTFSQ